jgi:hypothetical protein
MCPERRFPRSLYRNSGKARLSGHDCHLPNSYIVFLSTVSIISTLYIFCCLKSIVKQLKNKLIIKPMLQFSEVRESHTDADLGDLSVYVRALCFPRSTFLMFNPFVKSALTNHFYANRAEGSARDDSRATVHLWYRFIISNIRMICKWCNGKKYKRDQPWHILRSSPGIFLESLRIKLGEDSWPPGWDFNPRPLEYETGMRGTWQWYSVQCMVPASEISWSKTRYSMRVTRFPRNKIIFFWDVMPCSFVGRCQSFGERAASTSK